MKMERNIFKFFMALFFALLPFNSFGMGGMPNSMSQEASVGQLAADFTLPTIFGKNLSFTQAREGKRSILFFWATWCPHCHEELEKVRQNLDTIKQRGIQIILINSGETKEEALVYLKDQGVKLDSYMDEDNTVAGQYSVIGVPSLFFVDEKGFVRSIEHDFPSDYEAKFK